MCIFEKITVDALVQAAKKCANGVRWKDSVAQWMFNVYANCARLYDKIINSTYKLQKYIIFNLSEKKPRIINSTRFPDRVVQRAMCDNGLYDIISKPLIYENGACLKGKGVTFTIKLFEKHLRKHFFSNNRRSNKGWYVKLDI